jgi:hypothetical protein
MLTNRQKTKILVDGGDPNETLRIKSPLRLPVPPSRRFVEVLDFTACFVLCSFVFQNNKCETVQ